MIIIAKKRKSNRSKPKRKSFPSNKTGLKQASKFYSEKKKAGKKPNFSGTSKRIYIGYKK